VVAVVQGAAAVVQRASLLSVVRAAIAVVQVAADRVRTLVPRRTQVRLRMTTTMGVAVIAVVRLVATRTADVVAVKPAPLVTELNQRFERKSAGLLGPCALRVHSERSRSERE
jgi:hypothetical protein